jgi:hypothetical protein
MPINIDHSKSGNVTLVTSNTVGSSTFVLPSINGESTILVSGSPISYVSNLQGCLNSLGSENPFAQPNAQAQIGALQQRTNPANQNYAIQPYSLAIGCNAATTCPYEIAQGVDSDGNCGWSQSSQFLFKTTTTTNQPCEIITGFKLGMTNTISYINGKIVAKGASSLYGNFDFCAVIVAEGQNSTCMLNDAFVVNSGNNNDASLGFYLQNTLDGSNQKYVSLKVSGNQTSVNWLLCMNELKLKTS